MATNNKSESAKETKQKEAELSERVAEKEKYTPKKLDPNQYVTVTNGYQGKLVYTSRKTGEQYVWEDFGAEEDMELSELKSARNAHKKFFTENWFMFDDPAVVEYLGVQQYYKNALKVDEFEDLFEKSNDEMKDVVSKLSKGQRKSVAYLARKQIADGTIDSRQKIATLENLLGVDLVEK